MKWVYGIFGALILLVLVIAIVGWLLPVEHEASRSAEFARTPNQVYALVADYRNYATWWPDIARIEVLADEPGKAKFREYLSDGPIVMSVVEQSSPSRFVTKIDDPASRSAARGRSRLFR